MSVPDKISRNSCGLSGEYFVTAELYRRGFIVGLTMGNAKAIDILAAKNGVSYQIQVKTIRRKKSICLNIAYEKIMDNITYIMVNLNWDQLPDYYIMNANEVRKFHKQYNNRGIVDLNPVHRDGSFLNKWEKLESK
mgnify:CR=1 FL=1